MNNSVPNIRATDLKFTRDHMIVSLEDGRILQMPLDWFPALRSATRTQLNHYEWIGRGIGIEWPDLDEFLSVEGFLRNTAGPVPIRHKRPSKLVPAPQPRRAPAKRTRRVAA